MNEVRETKKVDGMVTTYRIYLKKDSVLYRDKPIEVECFEIKGGVIECLRGGDICGDMVGIPLNNVDYYTKETTMCYGKKTVQKSLNILWEKDKEKKEKPSFMEQYEATIKKQYAFKSVIDAMRLLSEAKFITTPNGILINMTKTARVAPLHTKVKDEADGIRLSEKRRNINDKRKK